MNSLQNTIYDLIVIGSGPAGMTAVIYAKRAGLNVLIIEKNVPGGKMMKTEIIENYPGFKSVSGVDLSSEMFEQMMSLEPEYVYGEVNTINQLEAKKLWVVDLKNKPSLIAKTVIVATGMIEKKLGLPNEEKLYGQGISHCAICDGALYKKTEVVVLGGGNSAIEAAIFLASIVKKVHLVHRGLSFRADQISVDKLQNFANVELHLPFTIKEIIGDYKLEKIVLQAANDNDDKELLVAALFIYIGLEPIVNFAQHLTLFDQNRFIIVDEKMATSYAGLYAVGDVISKKVRQITNAVAEATIAVINAKEYLESVTW